MYIRVRVRMCVATFTRKPCGTSIQKAIIIITKNKQKTKTKEKVNIINVKQGEKKKSIYMYI